MTITPLITHNFDLAALNQFLLGPYSHSVLSCRSSTRGLYTKHFYKAKVKNIRTQELLQQ